MFLHSNKELSENEVEKMISFTIASKTKKKYLMEKYNLVGKRSIHFKLYNIDEQNKRKHK